MHRILEDENVHLERYHAHDEENVGRGTERSVVLEAFESFNKARTFENEHLMK